MNAWVAIVTVLALLFYAYTGIVAGRTRGRHGVAAPAMTGHPEVERALRVQGNTLEWLVIFVPSLWLFADFVEPRVAALLGLVWIVGRWLYMQGYLKDPAQRRNGFLIQLVATAVLALGALIGAVVKLAAG